MFTIIIKDLKCSCIIGVNPEERQTLQLIIIDLRIKLDLSSAASTDNIEETIDYDVLANKIIKFVEKTEFQLIEKLALEVANLVKVTSKAKEVQVKIKKPNAIADARFAAVELTI